MGTYTSNGIKVPTTDLSAYKKVSFTVDVPSSNYTYYIFVPITGSTGYFSHYIVNNSSATGGTSQAFSDDNINYYYDTRNYTNYFTFKVSGYEYSSNSWSFRSASYSTQAYATNRPLYFKF